MEKRVGFGGRAMERWVGGWFCGMKGCGEEKIAALPQWEVPASARWWQRVPKWCYWVLVCDSGCVEIICWCHEVPWCARGSQGVQGGAQKGCQGVPGGARRCRERKGVTGVPRGARECQVPGVSRGANEKVCQDVPRGAEGCLRVPRGVFGCQGGGEGVPRGAKLVPRGVLGFQRVAGEGGGKEGARRGQGWQAGSCRLWQGVTGGGRRWQVVQEGANGVQGSWVLVCVWVQVYGVEGCVGSGVGGFGVDGFGVSGYRSDSRFQKQFCEFRVITRGLGRWDKMLTSFHTAFGAPSVFLPTRPPPTGLACRNSVRGEREGSD